MAYKSLKMNSEALKIANSIASSRMDSITGVAIRRTSGQILTVNSDSSAKTVVSRGSKQAAKEFSNSKTLRCE
jgi:hypothetical protein